jgi:drug/metabolite transporter (DMT)-like permease
VLIWSYVVTSIVGLIVLFWLEPTGLRFFANFTWVSWLGFGYRAVVTYTVAMLLFFQALKQLDVSTASLSLYLLPLFGVILAAVLLGERLSPLGIIGSGIVLASTLII